LPTASSSRDSNLERVGMRFGFDPATSRMRYVVLFRPSQGGWGPPMGHPKPTWMGGQTISRHVQGPTIL
jgi:hypothetical protein